MLGDVFAMQLSHKLPKIMSPFLWQQVANIQSGGLRIYLDQNFGKKEASKVT